MLQYGTVVISALLEKTTRKNKMQKKITLQNCNICKLDTENPPFSLSIIISPRNQTFNKK